MIVGLLNGFTRGLTDRESTVAESEERRTYTRRELIKTVGLTALGLTYTKPLIETIIAPMPVLAQSPPPPPPPPPAPERCHARLLVDRIVGPHDIELGDRAVYRAVYAGRRPVARCSSCGDAPCTRDLGVRWSWETIDRGALRIVRRARWQITVMGAAEGSTRIRLAARLRCTHPGCTAGEDSVGPITFAVEVSD